MYEKKKYSVLVVSSSEKMNEAIKTLLPLTKYSVVNFAGSVSAAKRAMLQSFYDFVIINTPLGDDFGTDFAIEVCRKNSSVCMLLVKSDNYERVNHMVIPYGVFTLPKPTSSTNMKIALSWLASARERIIATDKKKESIEDKMKEIRIVNRAKWLLIENLKMTEAEAHRYIEKQAMDNCISKLIIAEDILKTYQK